MHRLSEHTVIQGDTCNGAEKLKQLLVAAAESAGRAAVGEAAWAGMEQAERDAKVKSYIGRCGQHQRNIIINAQSLKQTESLKAELEDSLDDFSAYERMSVAVSDLMRRRR